MVCPSWLATPSWHYVILSRGSQLTLLSSLRHLRAYGLGAILDHTTYL